MTDQLEQDLRAMLTARAAAVSADPAASEPRIAERLRTGDDAVAAVLPMPARAHRGRWLAAAAAAVVLVGAVAIALTRDDADVRTGASTDPTPGPVEPIGFYTASGTEEEVARAYLVDRLEAEPDDLDLVALPNDTATEGFSWTRTDTADPSGGIVFLDPRDDGWTVTSASSNVEDPSVDPDGPTIDSAERDRDRVTVRTTAPARSYVQLSVHLLTGEAITAGGCGGESVGPGSVEESEEPVVCALVDEPIDRAGDDPVTIRFSVVTPDGVRLSLDEQLLLVPEDDSPDVTGEDAVNPLRGEPGDAAKDVAERVMGDLLGDPSITTSAMDAGDGVHEVTLETSTGAEVVATVVVDDDPGVFRLTHLASPGMTVQLTDDDELVADLPVGGTAHVRGFTEDFSSEREATPAEGVAVAAGRTAPLPQPPADHGWIVLRLETADGQVLWSLSWR